MDDYMKNSKGKVFFHIDHVIPSSYFTQQLELDEQQKIENEEVLYKWWNYRNLRVWPAKDNIQKYNTLDMDLIKQHGIEDLL